MTVWHLQRWTTQRTTTTVLTVWIAVSITHNPANGVTAHSYIRETGDADAEANLAVKPPRYYGMRSRGYNSQPNNVLAYGMGRPAGTAYYHQPNWVVEDQADMSNRCWRKHERPIKY